MQADENIGIFSKTAQYLNRIKTGFKTALEEEVRSQNMKTELISNVSHDLKTPLTSIINYSDLLKQPNLTKEQQEEYIDTIHKKSQRLKVLIEDLFEASKASSGNIKLQTERLDIVSVFRQTMGELEEKENPNPLLEDVKRAIVDFCKREYEDDSYTYENFNNLFPDLAHIGIAYTTTPDEKHEIQYEISLEDFTATQYINGESITKIDYLKDLGSEEKALEFLKQEMEYGDFGEFVSIDDNDLKKALGLERDDDGNIYDPLAEDLDNDGVPDRYDNDFRDSDYFETTYDVEDNLNARAESKEKPSILGQIKSYQSQEKQAETRENKSKEHDER